MDKLTIINRALVATSNGTVTLNDGTPEWQAADTAFDRAVEELISEHGWPFARTSADLVKAATNPSKKWDYAHQLPTDVLHLKGVYVGGSKTENFEILGRLVCLDAISGVSVEYIANPSDTSAWHPQASAVLTLMVEAGVLRGLNEDFTEARMKDGDVELKLGKVRSLVDGENPGHNTFRGGATVARRRRRG